MQPQAPQCAIARCKWLSQRLGSVYVISALAGIIRWALYLDAVDFCLAARDMSHGLQVLVKADCKALHPHWTVLLPVHTPLATRAASATLVDVVVNDPLVKVRHASGQAP